MDPREYSLRVSDVVKQLHVSTATVAAWITTGELPAIDVRAGNATKPAWRIAPEDLRSFIASRSNQPKHDIPAPSKKTLQKITQYV